MVRCMDLTLRSNEKSKSSSEQSRMVPWCTKPAAIEQDVDLADAFCKGVDVSRVGRTSRACRLGDTVPWASDAMADFVDVGWRSRWRLRAPNAIAQGASDAPAAAAVTTARLALEGGLALSRSSICFVIARSEATKQSICPPC